MTSRFTLGSTLCFTKNDRLHETGKLADSPLVIIAQSSATIVPPILVGYDLCRRCPARAWKQP